MCSLHVQGDFLQQWMDEGWCGAVMPAGNVMYFCPNENTGSPFGGTTSPFRQSGPENDWLPMKTEQILNASGGPCAS